MPRLERHRSPLSHSLTDEEKNEAAQHKSGTDAICGNMP